MNAGIGAASATSLEILVDQGAESEDAVLRCPENEAASVGGLTAEREVSMMTCAEATTNELGRTASKTDATTNQPTTPIGMLADPWRTA